MVLSMASPTPPPESLSSTHNGRAVDGIDKPASTACTECRRKHVRCDATAPICLRCASTGAQCCYLPSRRGLKRRTRDFEEVEEESSYRRASGNGTAFTISSLIEPSTVSYHNATNSESSNAQWPVEPAAVAPTSQYIATPSPTSTNSYSNTYGNQSLPINSISQILARHQSVADNRQNLGSDGVAGQDDDTLLNLYYTNFHAAHPFLVPRTMFMAQNYPEYLCKTVRFIGSHYSAVTVSQRMRDSVGAAIVEAGQQQHQGLHLVQARLLFSIALHARNEIKDSVLVLAEAVSLALNIGLDREDFCIAYGPPKQILAESVRRTWWELYVTDGFTAALQRKTSFLCHDVRSNMPLPCSEDVYIEGALLNEPHTIAQFEARIFAENELPFSSFCYRVGAVQNLARVLAISGTHEIEEEQVQAIDATLSAWPHHLPPDKTSPLSTNGDVNEMLFQAQMLIQYTIIYLHFPRSHLVATVPATSDIIRQRHFVPFSTRTMHGVKAIEASKQLGNLAALQTSVVKHTPFFIFAVVFGAIVQLSAFSTQDTGAKEHYRDRISLITGVLKTLGPVWTFSRIVARKLRRIAAELFNARPNGTHAATHVPPDSIIDPALASSMAPIADIDYWMDFFETDYLGGVDLT